MNSSAIRNHLYSLIKVADDQKLKAIYSIVKDNLQQNEEWWKDKAFVTTLKKEYTDLQSGNARSFTMEEISASFEKAKKRRLAK